MSWTTRHPSRPTSKSWNVVPTAGEHNTFGTFKRHLIHCQSWSKKGTASHVRRARPAWPPSPWPSPSTPEGVRGLDPSGELEENVYPYCETKQQEEADENEEVVDLASRIGSTSPLREARTSFCIVRQNVPKMCLCEGPNKTFTGAQTEGESCKTFIPRFRMTMMVNTGKAQTRKCRREVPRIASAEHCTDVLS